MVGYLGSTVISTDSMTTGLASGIGEETSTGTKIEQTASGCPRPASDFRAARSFEESSTSAAGRVEPKQGLASSR